MSERISIDRILAKLDDYFSRKDYAGAKRHLLYWYEEACASLDLRSKLMLCNELIGLTRRTESKDENYFYGDEALKAIDALEISESIAAATTYVNIATSYKAFGEPRHSMPLFQKALEIHNANSSAVSAFTRGSLLNNMALSLADLGRFEEAFKYFRQALDIMVGAERGQLEMAVTCLNMASATELQMGLESGAEKIEALLDKAQALLDIYRDANDGHYAFVCEKCASVFEYYGYFAYAKELNERVRAIYERA